MSHLIEIETIKEKKKAALKEQVKNIRPLVVEKTKQSVNFLILWTAVGWYYFFSGIYMIKYGKLPKGWKPITEKEVNNVISNVAEFSDQRKSEKRYGKVVNLDEDYRHINLLK